MTLAQNTTLDVEGEGRNVERKRWSWRDNKRVILTASSVAVVLMVLMVSVIVYVNQNGRDSSEEIVEEKLMDETRGVVKAGEKNITLPDVLAGVYGYRGYNGTWISDTQIQYFDSERNLVVFDVVTQEAENLISTTKFQEGLGSQPFEVVFSQDRQFALCGYDSQQLYRHSFYAKYAIYYVADGTFEQIKVEGGAHDLLQLVQWAPVTNAVAFVYENNVYYRPSPAKGTGNTKVTTSGSLTSQIFNGVTDWVYEEEMFFTPRALWFSTDGLSFAYVTFDDTNVGEINYSTYGEPGSYPRNQYPTIETIAFPKAGTDNPTIKVTIVTNLEQPSPTQQEVNLGNTDVSYYIGTAFWPTSTELLVVTANRHQNHTATLLCTAAGTCTQILEVIEPNGWIDVYTPVSSKNGGSFLNLQSVKQDDGRSYRHIVQFSRTSGGSTPITSGKFAVDSISGWDEVNNEIFFMSTGYDQTTTTAFPIESHLYSFKANEAPNAQLTCLTCPVQSDGAGTACLTNSASLSQGFKYVAHSCTGPSVPEVHIRSVADMASVYVWQNNTQLKDNLVDVALPIIQNYDVPVANGFMAKARLWLPPNYDKTKKYPLFVNTYGGPGSQQLSESYFIDWGMSLVSSKEVIYASIDGRGTGRQSDEHMFQMYRQMGTVEIEDQIAVTKWLIENNVDDVIDADRTAIWGWSYGGYATAMAMGTDVQGVFKCGISVAPVTSWVFYDTIYTERYMGLPTPEDNLAAYNATDVTNHIQNFRNHKFYLIHGNADDNVHYQQSMVLSRALEKADILFRQQSYPNEDHSIGSVRPHLYHSLESFLFEECF